MRAFVLSTYLMTLTSCGSMTPTIFQSLDDIATDDVATATVYKGAMRRDTNVLVSIEVTNRDRK